MSWIDRIYTEHIDTLAKYHLGDESKGWAVCYSWWRVYYATNRRIHECTNLNEKIIAVDEFNDFRIELNELYDSISDTYDIDNESEEPLDLFAASITDHLKGVITIMRAARSELEMAVKEVIKERKGGARLAKKAQRGRRRWLRS